MGDDDVPVACLVMVKAGVVILREGGGEGGVQVREVSR